MAAVEFYPYAVKLIQVYTEINKRIVIPVFYINGNAITTDWNVIRCDHINFQGSALMSINLNEQAITPVDGTGNNKLSIANAGNNLYISKRDASHLTLYVDDWPYVTSGINTFGTDFPHGVILLYMCVFNNCTICTMSGTEISTVDGFYSCSNSNFGYFDIVKDRDDRAPVFSFYKIPSEAVKAAEYVLAGQYIPPDPYDQIPTTPTVPTGGDKPYDPFSTDDINFSDFPEVSAIGTGFISLWCPTEQQMLDLSAYMWNADVTTLDFWRKLVADPLQLVYGLNIIPVNLRNAGIVGSSPEDVVVGIISTGVKMDYLTSQWVEVDCGSLDIDESMLGSYMDYDPYTKLEIYLPYIGYRPLKVDDFMPGSITVKYRIDLLTGSCVAQVKSTKLSIHDDQLNSVMYQFMGNCATQIPVTASQFADAVRSAIQLGASIGTIVALGGAGAGVPAAAAGATLLPAGGSSPGTSLMVPQNSLMVVDQNNLNSMIGPSGFGGGEMPMLPSRPTLSNVGMMHAGAAAAENVMGIKPNIERSGAIGGSAGLLATQKPYLIFTRPRVAHPEGQSKYTGYPSFMTKVLGTLSGFTQIENIHLEGLPCTSDELAEVDALLKSGVIF